MSASRCATRRAKRYNNDNDDDESDDEDDDDSTEDDDDDDSNDAATRITTFLIQTIDVKHQKSNISKSINIVIFS